MSSSVAGDAPAGFSQPDEDLESLLVALRSTLGDGDETRLRSVEHQLKSFQHQAQSQAEAAQAEARDLRAELEKLRRAARENENLVRDLQSQLYILNHRMQAGAADADGLLGMSALIRRTVLDSRDDMAEALGPVMGEAIRVQIRDSRQDMVEALYPVIGESVQRSVVEAFRDLQRNIDARLKAVVGPRNVWRTFGARLRGVSPAQLALRDALPFAVQSAFLIQHGSGLLLVQSHTGAQVVDSDLVSGMLTAIRDFVHDSFGQGQADKHLDEIQYGNQRIVIQSGQVVYLAVLVQGVEPEGFRARLHDFVSELDVRHARSLREYSGDPETLPDLQPGLDRLVSDLASLVDHKPMKFIGRRAMMGAGLIGLLLIAVACFYLQFTVALLPIAFPGPTPTPTATGLATPSDTPTLTATATATRVPSVTPQSTPTPAPTVTTAPTPTAVVGRLPVMGKTAGNVWVRPQPDQNSPRTVVLLKDTPVRLVSVYGPWAELEWSGELGLQRGWVLMQWIATLKSIPPDVVTPYPTLTP
jgi:hypothetical protein